MENKRFKIGETVIALSDSPGHIPSKGYCQPRTKGRSYVVQAVLFCSKCGTQKINIGPLAQGNSSKFQCGCENIQPNQGLAWTGSMHFARPRDLNIEIAIAVKQENYELAHELSQIIKH